MSTKKENKDLWSTIESVLKKEKLSTLKLKGFVVNEFNMAKNYQQKRIDISFEVLYEVQKGKWGVFRKYDCSYNEENKHLFERDVKQLKWEMQHQKVFNSNLKKEDVRHSWLSEIGWNVYYLS